MDATENMNDAVPVQRPWIRRTALALTYIIVWVALWHTADAFNRMSGFNLWTPCAGLTFALLLEYGSRALPLPLLAALLAGWPTWSGEQWPYGLAVSLGPLPGYNG